MRILSPERIAACTMVAVEMLLGGVGSVVAITSDQLRRALPST